MAIEEIGFYLEHVVMVLILIFYYTEDKLYLGHHLQKPHYHQMQSHVTYCRTVMLFKCETVTFMNSKQYSSS